MSKKSGFDRRGFLTSVALGAGLAPFVHLARTRSEASSLPQSASLCHVPSGRAGVLAPSDLQYLGSFKMPSDGVLADTHPPYYFNYSDAALTGRRVGGVPTLLIQGAPDGRITRRGPALVEMTIPNPSIGNPPRASLVRSWDNIVNGRDLTLNQMAVEVHGLGIDPDDPNRLWVGYKKYYSNDADPNTLLTVLNNDGTCASFGPWRHGGGGYPVDPVDSTGATFAHFVQVPASMRSLFGGRRMASGGVEQSHLAGLSYGCNLHAWNPVSPNTPADPTVGTAFSISDYPLLFFPDGHRQRRTQEGVNFKLCYWTPPTPSSPEKYDATRGSYVEDPQPVFGGGGTANRDNSTCAVMVDTGSKRGVVFFGQLVDTIAGHTYEHGSPQIAHNWYGVGAVDKNGRREGEPGFLGLHACPHGQLDPTWMATGPGAGTMVGYCWIFDPADLAAVGSRAIKPWDPDPVSAFRISSIRDCNIPDQVKIHRQYGGAWYDEVTKRIYLSAAGYDVEGYSPVPRIHVFQVLA